MKSSLRMECILGCCALRAVWAGIANGWASSLRRGKGLQERTWGWDSPPLVSARRQAWQHTHRGRRPRPHGEFQVTNSPMETGTRLYNVKASRKLGSLQKEVGALGFLPDISRPRVWLVMGTTTSSLSATKGCWPVGPGHEKSLGGTENWCP